MVMSHADALFRYAVKLTGNSMEAEDVVQNTFEKIWIRKDQITIDTVKALCYRITHNNVMDNFRRKKLEREAPIMGDISSTSDVLAFESRDIINQGFLQLSEVQKSLILLRDYEGYSYEDIAEILEMSLGKVKVYLFRARKQMQKEIKELEIDIKL